MDSTTVTLDIDKIQKRIDRTTDDSNDSEERPSKRPRQDLFLSDSDDDTIPSVKRKDPPVQDIDALFDVEDDIDEEMAFKPLPPALNEEELRSQAEARYRRELPPLTPHQVLPTQLDTTENPGTDRHHTSKDNQSKDEKKERRKLVKLDENRLLSQDGFPQLMKMIKDFRINGKGHEATDLNRLLKVYQYWTHQLYPKTQFRDTVERVEKLCHSRRMNVSLSVWRDEAHGRFNRSNTPEDEEGMEDEDEVNNSRVVEHSNPNLPPPSSFQVSSTEPSLVDANTESNSRETEAEGIQGIDFVEEGEAFWRSPEIITGDEFSTNGISVINSSMDQDQDMWDIVDEFEKDGQTPSVLAPIIKPITQPTIPVPPNSGDDWEDMYL